MVAFSAAEVYAIAELIRRRRGGCAVVMGRLSPRTRNAQVALYQDKEVDFLVATDAIGMGLNMDVDHVAFAGLSKHDGHRIRSLTAAEIAQIAGRAGRGMRDGTFGSTADCHAMPDELVAQVEAHAFPPLDVLCWRNGDLDFSEPRCPARQAAGAAAGPGPGEGQRGLRPGDARRNWRASPRSAVWPAAGRASARLWEACQIPDFRKLADETHNQLCARVFSHVASGATLPTDWLGGQIAALARPEGDIDTLMQRLAGIRVWSYIAARPDWVRDAPHWQGRAREKSRSSCRTRLHAALTARFVDRRAAHLLRRLEATDRELLSAVTRRGEVVVEGHSVGHVGGFEFIPDPGAAGEERRLVLRAARRALREEMPRRVAAAEAAADSAFALTAEHALLWDGQPIAQLRPGGSLLRPRVEVSGSEFLDGAERERLRLRLQRFVDDAVRFDLAPLFEALSAAESDAALRGPLHRLREALGVIPGSGAEAADPALRTRLKAAGARAGRFALFIPALLKPRPAAMRARLWALAHGLRFPRCPPRAWSPAVLRPTGRRASPRRWAGSRAGRF